MTDLSEPWYSLRCLCGSFIVARRCSVAKSKAEQVAEKSARLYNQTSEITLGDDMDDTVNYIPLPSWWQEATGVPGVPFRKLIQIAGDSDSGKTSFSIAAIKAAQDQGVTVLYIETEGKTTKQDFINWQVDPKKIYILKEAVAEEIYDKVYKWLVKRYADNPAEKVLVVIDSVGNVLSKSDLDRELTKTDARPGGKGKSNREGLKRLIAKAMKHDIALVVINYTYDNIGSPGKTNAGGKALNFFSSLTYQTSRKAWIEATVKGVKVRKGAKVVWKLFKNHLSRQSPGPKVVEFDITAEGIKLAGTADE